MIDWNVNEIKRHISRREISPLRSPFSTLFEGMIKIRRGGTTWTSMDEAPDEKTAGSLLLSSIRQRIVNHAIWRGVTSNVDLQWGKSSWISHRKWMKSCLKFFPVIIYSIVSIRWEVSSEVNNKMLLKNIFSKKITQKSHMKLLTWIITNYSYQNWLIRSDTLKIAK